MNTPPLWRLTQFLIPKKFTVYGVIKKNNLRKNGCSISTVRASGFLFNMTEKAHHNHPQILNVQHLVNHDSVDVGMAGDSQFSSFENISYSEVVAAAESVSDLRKVNLCVECPDQLNMSFAGCGFLGIYHLGVAKSLQKHGKKLLNEVDMFGGASAGALVSTLLALMTHDHQIVDDCVKWCLDTAELVHKSKGGLMNPSLCLMSKLQAFLNQHIPDDGHLRASGRVFISITEKSTQKNCIISEFESKEELIDCMLASSYVPYITGKKTIKWRGKKYIDGGMTDNLPLLAQGRTILVTPFSGNNKDIAPVDSSGRAWNVKINKENFQVTLRNMVRGLHAFFPPKIKYLKQYYERGQRDCIMFLKKEGRYEQGEGEESDSGKNVGIEVRGTKMKLEQAPESVQFSKDQRQRRFSRNSLQYESAV